MQDTSAYANTTYAARVAGWLAAAQPLNLTGNDLLAYCDVTKPDHADTGDVLVQYRNPKEFELLAKQLAPMLTDTKVS